MKMKNDEQAIYEMKMKIDCGVSVSFLEQKWPISRFLLFRLPANRHTPENTRTQKRQQQPKNEKKTVALESVGHTERESKRLRSLNEREKKL